MQVELYGLQMVAEGITIYLWSPWRCSALEHRLFESVKSLPGVSFKKAEDEYQLELNDPKQWEQAKTHFERILKGWQEEAVDGGRERRSWGWWLEADTNINGYDTQGERASFWAFVRLAIERGGPGESDKGEDLELNGFGICFWNEE